MGLPEDADPVGALKKIKEVKAGIRKERVKDPYGYKRAFKRPIPERYRKTMRESFKQRWGTERPVVLDSFAGGGSIPLEAYRLGVKIISSELNPVASILERATVEYPAELGPGFAKEIEAWGKRISSQVESQMAGYFPRKTGETELSYYWCRTVNCPQCELLVPLSPNWWLHKGKKLGYQPIAPEMEEGNKCTFKVRAAADDFNPSDGTVSYGSGACIRCGAPLEGDYIKEEAQQDRMGHQLAAIGFKIEGKVGRRFREVTDNDLEGVQRAETLLEERLPEWESKDFVPNEERYIGPADRSANYGVLTHRHLYNSRQLLVHLTTLETILRQPWDEVKNPKQQEALSVYIAYALMKALNFNSIMTRPRATWGGQIASTFDRHDFSFKWSYGEIDGAGHLFEYATDQQVDAYSELAKMVENTDGEIEFRIQDATKLSIEDRSVHAVVIDPPYYDNVMYAELSDFFYVWQKRLLESVFPEIFSSELTDKDAEVVANRARFQDAPRGKAKKLADEDYTAKMAAAFNECHRVLQDDGAMTVMFTHKRVDAWDALGRALIQAGFEIDATWPIHSESQVSLHQAKKNAAASTILLVCRKRDPDAGSVWWSDLEDELRDHVRDRAEDFAEMGLRGQDTSIACFGPALQVLSRQWPVKRKDGSNVSPDEALDLARAEVMDWFFERIAEGKAKIVDKWTRFYVLGWYVFKARKFPYDEALKLSRAVGVDIDKELIPRGLLRKKGKYVILQKAKERFQKGDLDPTDKSYDWDVDYVHAAIHAYEQGQSAELTRFHQRTEALQREGYRNAIGYLLDVLPRAKEVTEYHALDQLWEANLQDRVKRRKPRDTDPTFEKQQRLESFGDDDREARSAGGPEEE